MKHLLIISYFFPPLGGPGVQRAQKFVKYLPEFGWEPIVLTVKKVEYIAYDESLLKEIPDTEIYRTETLDPMRLLYFGEKLRKKKKRLYETTNTSIKNLVRSIFPIDSKIGWIPFALSKGSEIIKSYPIKVILATIGPYTDAIIGYKLAKKYNLPLILDYRDLWQGSSDITYFSSLHRKLSFKMEKKILDFASKIIINTNKAKRKIQSIFPQVKKQKFTVIYNGWDKNDFKINNRQKNDKLVFTYTGGFYGNRTPIHFIKALEALNSENKIPEQVIFRFIGNYPQKIKQILHNKRLNIQLIPQVTHQQCIKYLLESDVLLLFIAADKSEIVIPAKVFEYLRAQKPILAMVPEKGEAAELIKLHNAGYIVNSENEKEIKRLISEIIELNKTGNLVKKFNLKKNDYLAYERKTLTQNLADILTKYAKN